jgi:RimJ/RimL family protein N-acetyltransferase
MSGVQAVLRCVNRLRQSDRKNLASAAVMLKNGMIEEGRIRDHVFTHDARRDSVTHSILESEWDPFGG